MSTAIRNTRPGRHPTAQRVLAALGVLFTTAMVGIVAGPLGVLVAVGVGVAQYFFGEPIAFAVGQVVLVGLYPSDGPIEYFILGEIGLTFVFLCAIIGHMNPVRSVVATLIAGGVVGGSTWFVFRSSGTIWISAVILVAGTGLIVYGMHRYERVRLGLVEGE